jgi:hypothetical protein
MNHKPEHPNKPPILPGFALLAAFAAGTGLLLPAVFADEPAKQAAGAPATATAAPAVAQETKTSQDAPQQPAAAPAADLPAADEILNQARTRLEGLESLECDLQQTAIIGGMRILAAGRYTEAAGNRVHLVFRMYPMSPLKVDDAKTIALDAPPMEIKSEQLSGELQQICDGAVVHTIWKNGDTTRVTRRTLTAIQEAAATAGGFESGSVAMDLGVGGLRSLISRLQTSMVFAPVRKVMAGDRALLEVTGRWSDRVRKEIFGLPEGTFVDARPWVPEYSRVYVDQESGLPRRIQYLKHSPNPGEKVARPLLTLDLRNLRMNSPVDAALFRFTPPENVAVEDQTDAVINAIRNAKAAPKP